MATNYYWIISSMDCVPKDGDYNDVVVTVHWRRDASLEQDGKTYYGDVYGAQSFSSADIQDFTPYDQLTFEQVCGWLDSSLNVEDLDKALDAQIENQINPPLITLPLPWNQSPTLVSDVVIPSVSDSQPTDTAQPSVPEAQG